MILDQCEKKDCEEKVEFIAYHRICGDILIDKGYDDTGTHVLKIEDYDSLGYGTQYFCKKHYEEWRQEQFKRSKENDHIHG